MRHAMLTLFAAWKIGPFCPTKESGSTVASAARIRRQAKFFPGRSLARANCLSGNLSGAVETPPAGKITIVSPACAASSAAPRCWCAPLVPSP